MKERTDNSLITIGKVGAPYGVQGWLKVQPYTEFSTSMLDLTPWFLESQNASKTIQQVTIEESKPHGKGLVVRFSNINTPEDARAYTNQLIVIKRSQLPELDSNEFYWSDLVGLKVIDQNNATLGSVAYLMETGSNDVIVIKDDAGKEHAIPFLRDSIVKAVDLDAKTILVEWELI